jgi:hypothetical protein
MNAARCRRTDVGLLKSVRVYSHESKSAVTNKIEI